MVKTEPSVGTDCVKKATAGGAPWKVSWAWNCRGLAVGDAVMVVARRRRRRVIVVAGCIFGALVGYGTWSLFF